MILHCLCKESVTAKLQTTHATWPFNGRRLALYLKQHPDILPPPGIFQRPCMASNYLCQSIRALVASKLDTTLNGGEPNYVLGGQNYKPVPSKEMS